MNLLHLDSSITGPDSVSRQLSAAIVDRLKRTHPGLTVVRRDLVADPLPYFRLPDLGGVAVDPEPQPASEAASVRLERRVLHEFMAADIVVVGAPMYNFGVPAQLKSWIDWLSVAGVTFAYTEQGPVGLAGGKRVIVASSRGGLYSPGSPVAFLDHQETYLEGAFRFFGVTDVEVVRAEGLKVSPQLRDQAIADALRHVDLLSSLPLAGAA